ncbi:hypothetical protein J6590_018920 [Homalodisca vitripennis]|nr:hypothetical protein J6590_018920 [Homalodisca vitripennis]
MQSCTKTCYREQVEVMTGEFDAYLCKQELERLQRLEEVAAAEASLSLTELDKPRRESASTIDDFFVDPPSRPHHSMSYVSPKVVTVHGPAEDDVFLKPPLWEDITSSIQKLDPENAEMLAIAAGMNAHIKLEVTDDMLSPSDPPSVLHPLSIKTEKVASPGPPVHLLGPGPASPYHGAGTGSPQFHQNYKMPYHRLLYAPPPTPPSSEPGSPGSLPRRTPPPPYPAPHIKYNRRNNPELEKRRVHHCDFIGCNKVYTKSSHLKAHQRIHTVRQAQADNQSQHLYPVSQAWRPLVGNPRATPRTDICLLRDEMQMSHFLLESIRRTPVVN